MGRSNSLIFVTGGTGFVGRHLVPLLGKNEHVRCLVEGKTRVSQIPHGLVEYVHGNLADREAVRRALQGCDRVVHLEGVPQESRRSVFAKLSAGASVLAAEMPGAGIRHLVMLSLVGAEPGSPFPFLRVQARAEEHLLRSGVPTAILRTTILYGPGDNFVERILGWSRNLPFVPVPSLGSRRIQPLHAADLAAALARMVRKEDETGAWDVGGPEVFTVDEAVTRIVRLLGRRRPFLHFPRPVARATAALAETFLRRPPLTLAQVDALQSNHLCPVDSFEKRFGWLPRNFDEGLRDFEARQSN